jgi:hypothetical protein
LSQDHTNRLAKAILIAPGATYCVPLALIAFAVATVAAEAAVFI